jgi:hypothetical protein
LRLCGIFTFSAHSIRVSVKVECKSLAIEIGVTLRLWPRSQNENDRNKNACKKMSAKSVVGEVGR